tara:strand:- start:939 stop:1550 length:612 start_codon:yes stop_codon:yes gene_type:complete
MSDYDILFHKVDEINLKNFLSYFVKIRVILANIVLVVIILIFYPNKNYTLYTTTLQIMPADNQLDIINFENINIYPPLSYNYKYYENQGSVENISRSTIKYTSRNPDNNKDYAKAVENSINTKIDMMSQKYGINLEEKNILFTLDDYYKAEFFNKKGNFFDLEISNNETKKDNHLKILILSIFFILIINISMYILSSLPKNKN